MFKKILTVTLSLALVFTAVGNVPTISKAADPANESSKTRDIDVTLDASKGWFCIALPLPKGDGASPVELKETGNLDPTTNNMIYNGEFEMKCYGVIPDGKVLVGTLSDNTIASGADSATVTTSISGKKSGGSFTADTSLKGYCSIDVDNPEYIKINAKTEDNTSIMYKCQAIPTKAATYNGTMRLTVSLIDA